MNDVILNQFLACLPVKDISWCYFKYAPESQAQLFNKIFNHGVVKAYPPASDYQLAFLKQWMKMTEENNYEITDEVYEMYAKLIGAPPTDTDYNYKSYHLGDKYRYITIQESRHFISHGTTGLHSWKAAFYLAEWVTEHKQIFDGKHILELGSGVGLLGLATCCLANPASYTFTDCDETVLQLLRKNVSINIGQDCLSSVAIVKLDWTTSYSLSSQVDFILASDIVYDPELIESLVDFFENLWSLHSEAVVIIASTIRNEDTFKYFLTKINRPTIKYQVCTPPSLHLFYYDRSAEFSVLELKYHHLHNKSTPSINNDKSDNNY